MPTNQPDLSPIPPPDPAADALAYRVRAGQHVPSAVLIGDEVYLTENDHVWGALDSVEAQAAVLDDARAFAKAPEIHDALIDLIHAATSALWAMGVDPRPLWASRHAARMAVAYGPF